MSAGESTRATTAAEVPVWDLGVRAFHWLLVISVGTAGVTGFFGARNALDVHLIAGSLLALLLLFRVVWGVLGGGFARFASFAFSPREVFDYAANLLAGRSRRHLGHNPLGAMMVYALLVVLGLIVLTGVIALGGQDKQGPLAAFVSFATGSLQRQIHKALALLLVAMVLAHLAGVLFESRHERENLTAAMVTGRKRAEPGARRPAWQARTRLAGLVVAGLAAATTAGVAGLSALPARGVPTAPLDADYKLQCSACHVIYHPSLLPAASWQMILDHLGEHFGEDASLDAATVAKLRTYLAANSAEHWDTLPAVMLRRSIDPADPARITATGFWRRMHHRLADRVFASPEVMRRSNCAACHTDAASGLFAPQNIEVPEDLQ